MQWTKNDSGRRRGGDEGTQSEKRKNLILIAVAAIVLLAAAYFIYRSYFAVPPAPADAVAPVVDSTFEEAQKAPPPAQDSEPLPVRNSGKMPQGGG